MELRFVVSLPDYDNQHFVIMIRALGGRMVWFVARTGITRI